MGSNGATGTLVLVDSSAKASNSQQFIMGFCAPAKTAKLAKGETCRDFAGSAGFAGDEPGGSHVAEGAMG
jgi:hypothetical protein